ncbi:MAG TPA: hypothetical protein VHG09_11645 [Longimicrobiales bacterium]|nr:hypothetical protein [Longimicrobiales bacterium]
MRKLLAFVFLFVSATGVQGQDPVTQEPAEPSKTAEAPATAESQVEPEGPASETRTPKVDMMSHSAATAAHDVATVRAPVDFDQPAQDVTAPQNFWWLVGAIVLGGIILAVLL